MTRKWDIWLSKRSWEPGPSGPGRQPKHNNTLFNNNKEILNIIQIDQDHHSGNPGTDS